MIRTRFAPSPTGYLHVGGLRTALYSYLLAKQNGGEFLLRIEDTDRERYVADGTLNILKSLYWAGIIPDEGVKLDSESVPGEHSVIQEGAKGPYIQSERLGVYAEQIKTLLANGSAYYCFCSKDRLDTLRQEQQLNKLPSKYDRECLKLTPGKVQEKLAAGAARVVRLKMPDTGETVFTDLIRGEVRFKNELIDDQVLIKSDGFPTYHLAVVVDDHFMNITHVIRGEEWISSTPKHLELYRMFGWEAPKFAHLPLLLNTDKSKLSKRQGDVAVADYEAKGYLSAALVNFVAFLGWNPGDERELFSLEELTKEFDLAKVSKAGAVFNIEKLDWYNKEYLKKMSPAELAERAKRFLALSEIPEEDKSLLEKAIALEQERVTTLSEIGPAIKFVFSLPEYPGELLIWKKSTREQVQKILPELATLLNTISVQDWQKELIEAKIKSWIGEKGYNNGEVLWPLRVALSGQEKSPPPFDIAAVLEQAETVRRLESALGKLQG